MTDKEKIRNEVKRLQKRAEHYFDISLTENEMQFWLGESNVLTLIGKYIDTMQEEPVSEDLEEEIQKTIQIKEVNMYRIDIAGTSVYATEDDMVYMAKHFAKWQAEQFEKERLKHCEELTPEQAQIESDFVTQHLKKNNRTPTFIDAIEYGMRLQKEQMIANTADAMIGLPYENKDGGYTHLIDVSRPLPVGNNKAEEVAYSKYPKEKKGVLYDLARNSIIEGYQQAEKNNELTWEDIPKILSISEQLTTSWWFRDDWQTKQIGIQEFWEEVLKQFKAQKESNCRVIVE